MATLLGDATQRLAVRAGFDASPSRFAKQTSRHDYMITFLAAWRRRFHYRIDAYADDHFDDIIVILFQREASFLPVSYDAATRRFAPMTAGRSRDASRPPKMPLRGRSLKNSIDTFRFPYAIMYSTLMRD